ncbi:MAG TPA: restriction endonuclease subunit S [Flavipsychrobacter sp.]|nr:restriction endonuclease subunit S [Flavipsychrobacter sp.]
MSEWKTYKLSGIVELIGGGTPKTSISEYWNGEIPWLSVVDFGNNQKHVYKTEKTITEKGLKESSTKILKKGQLIISARGTVGELAVLGKDMAFNQSCYGIVATDETENNFLYYLLKYNINKIKKNTHGAVFDTITKQTFDNIYVEIPAIKEQKQIASILSSLDDKIELNVQMNQTLEAIAQAIFKEWFVDFNFPGFDGKLVDGLPKGWNYLPIGQLFKNTIGGDWGKEEQNEEFSEKVYIVRGTDFDNILLGNISRVPVRFIKKDNLNRRRITDGSLLLEISGGSKEQPTGRTIFFTNELLLQFDLPIVPASFCRLIEPSNIKIGAFLNTFFNRFYSIGGTWEYQNQSTGISNFQFTYFAENKTLAMPENPNLIYEYSNLISPIIKKQHENILQIRTLTQVRDSLLPKLMSGKIEIKK